MKKASCFFFALLSLTPYAKALPIYVSAGAGGVVPMLNSSFSRTSDTLIYSPTAASPSLFYLPNVNWNNRYKSGYNLNLAVGAPICTCFRIEGEFLYQNFTRHVNGWYDWQQLAALSGNTFATQLSNPIDTKFTGVRSYSFLANLYYDFKNKTKWTPYLGAGVGVTWMNSDSTTVTNNFTFTDTTLATTQTVPVVSSSPALSGTTLAGQLKAGISYECSKELTFAAEYRVFASSKINLSNSTISINPNTPGAGFFTVNGGSMRGLVNNVFNINVRYALDL